MPKKAENPSIKITGTSKCLTILQYVRPLDLAKLNYLKFTLAALEYCLYDLSSVLHLRSQHKQGCRIIPTLLANGHKSHTNLNISQPLSTYLGWERGLGGFTCARCAYSCQERGTRAGHFLQRGKKRDRGAKSRSTQLNYKTGVTLYKLNINIGFILQYRPEAHADLREVCEAVR